jgi:hypothetical protein
VFVRTHRPFLIINLSHHAVVTAKSAIEISIDSLLNTIKFIFVETAIQFFLWSIIQFLKYSSNSGHLGANESEVLKLLSALIKSFHYSLHSRIFSVGGEPKQLSASQFTCFSA